MSKEISIGSSNHSVTDETEEYAVIEVYEEDVSEGVSESDFRSFVANLIGEHNEISRVLSAMTLQFAEDLMRMENEIDRLRQKKCTRKMGIEDIRDQTAELEDRCLLRSQNLSKLGLSVGRTNVRQRQILQTFEVLVADGREDLRQKQLEEVDLRERIAQLKWEETSCTLENVVDWDHSDSTLWIIEESSHDEVEHTQTRQSADAYIRTNDWIDDEEDPMLKEALLVLSQGQTVSQNIHVEGQKHAEPLTAKPLRSNEPSGRPSRRRPRASFDHDRSGNTIPTRQSMPSSTRQRVSTNSISDKKGFKDDKSAPRGTIPVERDADECGETFEIDVPSQVQLKPPTRGNQRGHEFRIGQAPRTANRRVRFSNHREGYARTPPTQRGKRVSTNPVKTMQNGRSGRNESKRSLDPAKVQEGASLTKDAKMVAVQRRKLTEATHFRDIAVTSVLSNTPNVDELTDDTPPRSVILTGKASVRPRQVDTAQYVEYFQTFMNEASNNVLGVAPDPQGRRMSSSSTVATSSSKSNLSATPKDQKLRFVHSLRRRPEGVHPSQRSTPPNALERKPNVQTYMSADHGQTEHSGDTSDSRQYETLGFTTLFGKNVVALESPNASIMSTSCSSNSQSSSSNTQTSPKTTSSTSSSRRSRGPRRSLEVARTTGSIRAQARQRSMHIFDQNVATSNSSRLVAFQKGKTPGGSPVIPTNSETSAISEASKSTRDPKNTTTLDPTNAGVYVDPPTVIRTLGATESTPASKSMDAPMASSNLMTRIGSMDAPESTRASESESKSAAPVPSSINASTASLYTILQKTPEPYVPAAISAPTSVRPAIRSPASLSPTEHKSTGGSPALATQESSGSDQRPIPPKRSVSGESNLRQTTPAAGGAPGATVDEAILPPRQISFRAKDRSPIRPSDKEVPTSMKAGATSTFAVRNETTLKAAQSVIQPTLKSPLARKESLSDSTKAAVGRNGGSSAKQAQPSVTNKRATTGWLRHTPKRTSTSETIIGMMMQTFRGKRATLRKSHSSDSKTTGRSIFATRDSKIALQKEQHQHQQREGGRVRDYWASNHATATNATTTTTRTTKSAIDTRNINQSRTNEAIYESILDLSPRQKRGHLSGGFLNDSSVQSLSYSQDSSSDLCDTSQSMRVPRRSQTMSSLDAFAKQIRSSTLNLSLSSPTSPLYGVKSSPLLYSPYSQRTDDYDDNEEEDEDNLVFPIYNVEAKFDCNDESMRSTISDITRHEERVQI